MHQASETNLCAPEWSCLPSCEGQSLEILPIILTVLEVRITWKVNLLKWNISIHSSFLGPRGLSYFPGNKLEREVCVCAYTCVAIILFSSKPQGFSVVRDHQSIPKLKSESMSVPVAAHSVLKAGMVSPWAAAQHLFPSVLELAPRGRACWAGLQDSKCPSAAVVTGDAWVGGRGADAKLLPGCAETGPEWLVSKWHRK